MNERRGTLVLLNPNTFILTSYYTKTRPWKLDIGRIWAQSPEESGLLLMQKNYITYRVCNETKYKANNNTGCEAIKSNDTSETPTKYNWNGSAWVSE